MASFVESAYANEGASFETNGERDLLKTLETQNFHTVFDVGANVGDWTIHALATWPTATVYSFEVAPQTFQALAQRVDKSAFRPRARMHCMGISNEPGLRTMYYFPTKTELTCDAPRHSEYESFLFDGRMTTLDDYCRDADIQHVDFLKIDIEGSEFRALQGFAEYLREERVTCLQFEYGAFATETRFLLADYYKLLASHFWIGKIYPSHVHFSDYEWTMEDFRFANYLCVSRRRPDLKQLLA